MVELATQMAEAPSAFARHDLVPFVAHLSLPQWRRFRDLQAGIRRNDPATEIEFYAIKRGLQLATKLLPPGTFHDIAANYRAELVEEIDTWRSINGKSPDDRDILEMIKRRSRTEEPGLEPLGLDEQGPLKPQLVPYQSRMRATIGSSRSDMDWFEERQRLRPVVRQIDPLADLIPGGVAGGGFRLPGGGGGLRLPSSAPGGRSPTAAGSQGGGGGGASGGVVAGRAAAANSLAGMAAGKSAGAAAVKPLRMSPLAKGHIFGDIFAKAGISTHKHFCNDSKADVLAALRKAMLWIPIAAAACSMIRLRGTTFAIRGRPGRSSLRPSQQVEWLCRRSRESGQIHDGSPSHGDPDMSGIFATICAATPEGRLYPRFDQEVSYLILESKVARPWVEGFDIDALIIIDLDDDLVLANLDLHIPMRSWSRTLTQTFDWSAPAGDLAFPRGVFSINPRSTFL